MTGSAIEIDQRDWQRFQRILDRLVDRDVHDLVEQLAGGIESQTRRRIADDKEGPDGEQWPAWSAAYAKTRGPGQFLLQGEGDLLDSITSEAHGETAEIGSNLDYAATHQFGDDERGIPARPYLGVSRDNLRALEQLTEHWAEALLR